MNKMAIFGLVGGLLVVGFVILLTSKTKSGLSDLGDSWAQQAASDLEDVDPELLESEGAEDSDLPPYFIKRMDHLRAMNRIMKKNITNCEAMGQEMDAYMQEHEQEMKELDRAENKHQLSMNRAERRRFQRKSMKIVKPMLFNMVKLAATVALRCPQQAKSIQQAKARVQH